MSRAVLGLSLWLVSAAAFADYGLNFQKPVTSVGQRVLELHNTILLICVVIFFIVFGVMFYSIYAHRKSRGHKAAKFHDNLKLEVVWTVIPFLILVAMAVPSTATLLEMDDLSKSEMTVKITGYQWKWKYDYPDQDVSFFSSLSTPREQIENKAAKGKDYLIEVDNPLVLPVGKKVRFVVTANDVLHAWWVPAFGVKKDAIPGFVNEMWARVDEPGIYRGQCAELCGKDHGYMPIVVQAVSPEDFDKWASLQKDKAAAASADGAKTWSKDELMEKGKKVYASTCAACHGANGEGVGPFPKMTGSKLVTGPVAGHLNIVMKGKPGTAMQAFGPQLNDADMAAVVTFERNAFGNNTGDVVQPAQVKAAR
ncbi:MAG: cytochrome c oxidase subunit II [Candidatus Muproteobacteria bacterium RBG_16_62_13]|uniref:Cytochrome c oxidase subunit 2 n=1 Tax=Candidatus Muproteobacteria bacterium RBG_16_62_13 TaxID=1817756 RepID=A0A1F6T041_9PROT|nr:MAG: cytochrome c oxidase subunit II [Candidatus Muproteobacteria bacterium RBG_16_62_13]